MYICYIYDILFLSLLEHIEQEYSEYFKRLQLLAFKLNSEPKMTLMQPFHAFNVMFALLYKV